MTIRPYVTWPLFITPDLSLKTFLCAPLFAVLFFLFNMPNLFLLQSLCDCCYLCQNNLTPTPILGHSPHLGVCSKVTSSQSPSPSPYLKHYPTTPLFTPSHCFSMLLTYTNWWHSVCVCAQSILVHSYMHLA